MQSSPYEPVFELTAETDGETLTLCGSYNGGKESTDMVVIEAELLSGYKVHNMLGHLNAKSHIHNNILRIRSLIW